MKIVADENIIYLNEFFNQDSLNKSHLDLVTKAGRDISVKDLYDADALLVRSVTQVNSSLLANTSVKFVGTATIGTDHIDLNYLQQQNIQFADAGGCSADTVAQYVVSCIHHLQPDYLKADISESKTFGIIGYGNIGKALAHIALSIGWQILIYDPFVTVTGNIKQVGFADLLANSDMISLHVPLTTQENSDFPTYHLINEVAFAQMQPHAMLINSARGKVVDELALMADFKTTKRQVVLDVFEHEPQISCDLLNSLAIATPHIAGYSVEGKARGTQLIYNAFCDWQKIPKKISFNAYLPNVQQIFEQACGNVLDLTHQLNQIYDVMVDDANLREIVNKASSQQLKISFDQLRKDYLLRREWQAYGLQTLSKSRQH